MEAKEIKRPRIPYFNQYWGFSIFILQHIWPQSQRLESLRQSNVQAVVKRLKAFWAAQGYNAAPPIPVERRQNLSEKEFVKNYLHKGIPVVFDGEAQSWPCTGKWDLNFLRDSYGDEEFSLIDSTGLVESELNTAEGKTDSVLVKKIKAREFVDSIRQGVKNYLRGCPILEMRPELLNDLNLDWLARYRRCLLGVSYQTFLGAAGRTTPIHNETTAFFFVLAEGEKKWTLCPVSETVLINPAPEGRGYNFSKVSTRKIDSGAYPGFEFVTKYVCDMKKGDILFVPAWMWHEVENLSESWALSYRFTYLRGFLRYPGFAFIRVFLAKPSFLETLYYSFFRSDMSKRDKNLLVPRIFIRK